MKAAASLAKLWLRLVVQFLSMRATLSSALDVTLASDLRTLLALIFTKQRGRRTCRGFVSSRGAGPAGHLALVLDTQTSITPDGELLA